MYYYSLVCYEKLIGNLLGSNNDYCIYIDTQELHTESIILFFHDESGFYDMLCFLG